MCIIDNTIRIIAGQDLEKGAADVAKALHPKHRQPGPVEDGLFCTLAHELLSPLTSVRCTAEILRDTDHMDPGQRRRFLDIIVQESDRLTRFVHRVLETYRE